MNCISGRKGFAVLKCESQDTLSLQRFHCDADLTVLTTRKRQPQLALVAQMQNVGEPPVDVGKKALSPGDDMKKAVPQRVRVNSPE
jgi:hypothetical protein